MCQGCSTESYQIEKRRRRASRMPTWVGRRQPSIKRFDSIGNFAPLVKDLSMLFRAEGILKSGISDTNHNHNHIISSSLIGEKKSYNQVEFPANVSRKFAGPMRIFSFFIFLYFIFFTIFICQHEPIECSSMLQSFSSNSTTSRWPHFGAHAAESLHADAKIGSNDILPSSASVFPDSRELLVVSEGGTLHRVSANGHIRWTRHLSPNDDEALPLNTLDPRPVGPSPQTPRLLVGVRGQMLYRGEDDTIVPLPIHVRDVVSHSPFSTPLFPSIYFLGKREAVVDFLDFSTGAFPDSTSTAEKSERKLLRLAQTRWVVRAVDVTTHVERWRIEWREVTPIVNLGEKAAATAETASTMKGGVDDEICSDECQMKNKPEKQQASATHEPMPICYLGTHQQEEEDLVGKNDQSRNVMKCVGAGGPPVVESPSSLAVSRPRYVVDNAAYLRMNAKGQLTIDKSETFSNVVLSKKVLAVYAFKEGGVVDITGNLMVEATDSDEMSDYPQSPKSIAQKSRCPSCTETAESQSCPQKTFLHDMLCKIKAKDSCKDTAISPWIRRSSLIQNAEKHERYGPQRFYDRVTTYNAAGELYDNGVGASNSRLVKAGKTQQLPPAGDVATLVFFGESVLSVALGVSISIISIIVIWGILLFPPEEMPTIIFAFFKLFRQRREGIVDLSRRRPIQRSTSCPKLGLNVCDIFDVVEGDDSWLGDRKKIFYKSDPGYKIKRASLHLLRAKADDFVFHGGVFTKDIKLLPSSSSPLTRNFFFRRACTDNLILSGGGDANSRQDAKNRRRRLSSFGERQQTGDLVAPPPLITCNRSDSLLLLTDRRKRQRRPSWSFDQNEVTRESFATSSPLPAHDFAPLKLPHSTNFALPDAENDSSIIPPPPAINIRQSDQKQGVVAAYTLNVPPHVATALAHQSPQIPNATTTTTSIETSKIAKITLSPRNESITLPPPSIPSIVVMEQPLASPVSRIPAGTVLADFVENGRFARTFKDVSLVGKGGFGSVYRVRHKFEPQSPQYAVKFVNLQLKGTANISSRRYFREVSANRDLFSRQVVRYFTWWCEEPQFLPHSPHAAKNKIDEDSNSCRSNKGALLKRAPQGRLCVRQGGLVVRRRRLKPSGSHPNKCQKKDESRRSKDIRGGQVNGSRNKKNQNRNTTSKVPFCGFVVKEPEDVAESWAPFSDSSQGSLSSAQKNKNRSFCSRSTCRRPSSSRSAALGFVVPAVFADRTIDRRSRGSSKFHRSNILKLPSRSRSSQQMNEIKGEEEKEDEFIVFEDSDDNNQFSITRNDSEEETRKNSSSGSRHGIDFGSRCKNTWRKSRPSDTIAEEQHYEVTLLIQMELVSGVTLRQWLDRPERSSKVEDIITSFSNSTKQYDDSLYTSVKFRFTTPVEVLLFRQLVKGLRDIHTHGIVHRDIKPENIFVNQNPLSLRIGDFGLARFIEAKSKSSDEKVLSYGKGLADEKKKVRKGQQKNGYCRARRCVDSVVSVKGLVIGTPGYTAPEGGALCTEKADVYSAALIFLELLCPRFETAMERLETLERFREKRKIPEHITNHLSAWGDLLHKMASVNPKSRPSADTVYRTIKLHLNTIVCETSPSTSSQSSPRIQEVDNGTSDTNLNQNDSILESSSSIASAASKKRTFGALCDKGDNSLKK